MRSAVNNAGKAFTSAGDTANTLGVEAQGIGANLTPFLTQEMEHPQGLGQAGIAAETGAALGGAGGANSGLVGAADQRAAATHNAGGYQAALADAARQRDKAAAGASEGIESQNENLKQTQSQEGAAGLGKMYGIDTSGQIDSQGQQAGDINAQVNAGNSGWLQNTMGILNTVANLSKSYKPGGY